MKGESVDFGRLGPYRAPPRQAFSHVLDTWLQTHHELPAIEQTHPVCNPAPQLHTLSR